MTVSIDLSGRTALIAGGSRGIGLGIARKFREAGAHVHLIELKQINGHESGSRSRTRQGGPRTVAWEPSNPALVSA